MIAKNGNSFSTNSNSNRMIINRIKKNLPNEKKEEKKVRFNEIIVIYNVESYKQHNKEFTYDEEKGYEEFTREFPNYFANQYNQYKNNKYFNGIKAYGNPNVTRKYVDPDCCCIVI